MNCERSHREKTVYLNEYFKTLGEQASDSILLITASGDKFEYFKNIDFGPFTDNLIESLEPGDDYVAIIDGSEKKNVLNCGKNVSVYYEWKEHEFGARREFADNSDNVYSYFTIDGYELKLEGKEDLEILLFSKSKNKILDLLSVNIRVDPVQIIEKADVDIFNTERRLHLNGLYDIINYHTTGDEEGISETANFLRRISYHISEILDNPKKLGSYAKARLASFYADRTFLNPDYPAALRWINSAIDSSNIDDDELIDNASVYYAVNQFLSKRNLPETLSEKERYFLNMPPAGGRLRLLQINAVILLKLFDEVCRRHNLEYWVIAGTLLGAVRHKGFIPWDDDIDVGMLRSDLYKLERILGEEYPELKFKKDVFVEKHDAYRSCKVYLKDRGPVFIDIFVFDMYDIPVESLEEKIKLCNNRIYTYTDYYKRKNNIDENGPLNDIQKADIDNILSMFSGDVEVPHAVKGKSIGYGADTIMPLLTKVKAYESETVFPCKSTMFENIEVKIPSDYHLFLEGYFGNYHTTPFNAFIKKHTELSDENIRDIKKVISEYSGYMLESDTSAD